MPEHITNNNSVYLDYNGTTPTAHEVTEVITRVLTSCWGNPSSSHSAGRAARNALEKARGQVAGSINAKTDEIIFTSGGTESNNTVLLAAAAAMGKGKRHIITSRIEHPSVLNPCIHLMEQGWDVTFAGVDKNGVVDMKEIENSIRRDTALVSVMLANNETGVIQPLRQISAIARRHGVPVHTDAAQALGKMEVDVSDLGVDYLSIAGHKLYAPKGIGALFVRKGAAWGNLMFGAGQEQGMRPGTEPVPGAAGLGEACRMATENLEDDASRMTELRERLFQLLADATGGDVVRYGQPDNVLSNTLLVSFPGRTGGEILSSCPGLMASTGAACHDSKVAVSHVLAAMNVPEKVALGTLRLTLGRHTTEQDIETAAQMIKNALSSNARNNNP